MIDFDYDGQSYHQFTRDDAIKAGVPSEFFDAALNAHEWQKLRDVRNQKIAKTDWTVLSDAPISSEMKAAFKAYRDALRDFPETLQSKNIAPDVALNDPSVWPQKPQ